MGAVITAGCWNRTIPGKEKNKMGNFDADKYIKAQNGPGWWHSYFSVDITEALE